MADLRLVPLSSTDAHPYWQVYLDGRTDTPTRSLTDHVERYIALSPEEQRTHFAFRDGDRIVGTVRLAPGVLYGFAMAPSHQDRSGAAIVKALDVVCAQGSREVTATFEDRYEDAFRRTGFERSFARIRMEAPTAGHVPPRHADLRHPEEAEVAGLARFLRAVYEGHMEQAFGMHVGSDDEWREYATGLLKGEVGRFMPDASFVRTEGDRVTGAVLTTHWMGAPLVAELGVIRDRRGQGLGRALLVAALNRLAALGEPRLALYVTVGNDSALTLYRSLGFVPVGGQTVTAKRSA